MTLIDRLRNFLTSPSQAPDTAGPALADTPTRSGGVPSRNRTGGEPHHTSDDPDRADESGRPAT